MEYMNEEITIDCISKALKDVKSNGYNTDYLAIHPSIIKDFFMENITLSDGTKISIHLYDYMMYQKIFKHKPEKDDYKTFKERMDEMKMLEAI